jgi:hypothetical protein
MGLKPFAARGLDLWLWNAGRSTGLPAKGFQYCVVLARLVVCAAAGSIAADAATETATLSAMSIPRFNIALSPCLLARARALCSKSIDEGEGGLVLSRARLCRECTGVCAPVLNY